MIGGSFKIFLIAIFIFALFNYKQVLAYTICAVMESGYIVGLENSACAGSATFQGPVSVVKTVGNNAPSITGYNLPLANTMQQYTGYISVSDNDDNKLSLSIDYGSTDWSSWKDRSGTDCRPKIFETTTKNAFKIYSCYVGDANLGGMEKRYYFKVTVMDAQGESTTGEYFIRVIGEPVITLPSVLSYTASTTNPLNFQIKATGAAVSYPLQYEVTGLPPYWQNTFELSGADYFYTLKAVFVGNKTYFNYPNSEKVHPFTLKIKNSANNPITKSFNVTVKNIPPTIEFKDGCADTVYVGDPFVCLIEGSDIDGHLTKLTADLPDGFKLISNIDSLVIENTKSCPDNFHEERGKCVYNINTTPGCSIANAESIVQYYNETTKSWGACEVVKCADGFGANADKSACESICSLTSNVKEVVYNTDGTCSITECNPGYHVESGACFSNMQVCGITNGTGYERWDAIINDYGTCVGALGSCTSPDYPNLKTDKTACINACGFDDKTTPVSFTAQLRSSDDEGYFKDSEAYYYDANNNKIPGKVTSATGATVNSSTTTFKSGRLGSNTFTVSSKQNGDFVTSDNKCKVTLSLEPMAGTLYGLICPGRTRLKNIRQTGGPVYCSVQLVDDSGTIIDFDSSANTHYSYLGAIHKKSIYSLSNPNNGGSTNWYLRTKNKTNFFDRRSGECYEKVGGVPYTHSSCDSYSGTLP